MQDLPLEIKEIILTDNYETFFLLRQVDREFYSLSLNSSIPRRMLKLPFKEQSRSREIYKLILRHYNKIVRNPEYYIIFFKESMKLVKTDNIIKIILHFYPQAYEKLIDIIQKNLSNSWPSVEEYISCDLCDYFDIYSKNLKRARNMSFDSELDLT